MVDEIMEFFRPVSPGLVVDGTAGGGGHLVALLDSFPDARFVAVDRDPAAVDSLSTLLGDRAGRVEIRASSYSGIPGILESIGGPKAGAALFDLGLSSIQLGDSARGFSHSEDGPLDMRFDTSSGPSAADLVNRLPEDRLADIIWKWGEEGRSRAITRSILRGRPIETTAQLAGAIRGASRGNPVKALSRVFQALRIAVNDEMGELQKLLDGLDGWIAADGRVAFITFHSIEDRMVKHFFRDSAGFRPSDPPWTAPGEDEIAANPRARSAKLRMGIRK
jgi:16S rRNA (cytosine1402-N4)-methyltransferase